MAFDPNPYRGATPADNYTPAEARKALADQEANSRYRAAWLNKNHPLHDQVVQHRTWLHEVIAGEPAPAGTTPSPLPKGPGPMTRILNARDDPAYLDKMHPRHDDLVAQVSQAYSELHPEQTR